MFSETLGYGNQRYPFARSFMESIPKFLCCQRLRTTVVRHFLARKKLSKARGGRVLLIEEYRGVVRYFLRLGCKGLNGSGIKFLDWWGMARSRLSALTPTLTRLLKRTPQGPLPPVTAQSQRCSLSVIYRAATRGSGPCGSFSATSYAWGFVQSGFMTWRARPSASAFSGTASVITLPAPM